MARRILGVAVAVLTLLLPALSRAEDSAVQAAEHERARPALTLVAGLGAAGLSLGAAALIGRSGTQRCVRAESESEDDVFTESACGWGGTMAGLGVSASVLPVLVTIGTALTHRALGGHAPWWVAALGTLSGAAAGLAEVVAVTNHRDSDGAFRASLVGAAFLSASVPLAALELSHARRTRPDTDKARGRAARVRINPSASMLRDGAWFGLSGTL
jgi:hypothetical protein